MTDQADGLRQIMKTTNDAAPRIIAVTSGKGGVGKTNISVNLALCLTQMKHRVALLDADLGMANVDIILGMSPLYTLTDVMNGSKEVQDIVVSGPLGLSILPGGSGVYELANLNQWNLDRFVGSVEKLVRSFDYVIIDTGAGISRNVLSFVVAAAEVLVVTTPEPTAITDAYGMIKTIYQQNPRTQISVIANMVRSAKDGDAVVSKINSVLRYFLNVEVRNGGYVFHDARVAQSVSNQEPFILAYPSSAAARSLERIAHLLVGDEAIQNKHGVRAFFKRVHAFLKS